MTRRTHPLILAVAAIVAASLVAAAEAAPIRIEAEAYSDSANVGGAAIGPVGGVLYGVDYPGDLTRYDLVTPGSGVYSVVMRVWGETGVSYTVRLIAQAAGEDDHVLDFLFVGKGTCGH